MIKKLINSFLKNLGYKIHKISTHQYYNEFKMEDALKRCSERGLIVNSVVDVGASDGRWSNVCMKYLPNAQYLLIEAQEAHRQGLERFKVQNEKVAYVIAAAGDKEGSVYFDNTGLFGGIASDTPFEDHCIEVPEITIDQEIKRRNMQPPFLIKLDTHGFERYIIKGALDTIKNTELIIIETYNYQLTKNSLKFYEICDYMEKLGFSTIEIVDFTLRNYDNSFWQMDIFFIRSSSKEFSYNSYK